MHTITADPESGIIEIKVEGFWTVEHVVEFFDELREQATAIRRSGKEQAVLYDYTHAAIQSQEVVAMLQDLARSDELGSRRVAIYTEGKLARTQARRVAAVDRRMATFDNRADALAWLTAS